MKVTNQKRQKLLRLRQAEEKKLNRFTVSCYKIKAAFLVCLFLLLACNVGSSTSTDSYVAAEWKFDDPTQKAYEMVLDLQLEKVHQLIPTPATAQQHYVVSLAEALELLITEDGEKYTEYEDRFTK